jgi:Xaa-Pro aminopeptidase
MLTTAKPSHPAIPFDSARLDRLMDEAGMDVLLATSKHNVQYLLAATAPSSSIIWMRWG